MLEKLFNKTKRWIKKYWKVLAYPVWLVLAFFVAQIFIYGVTRAASDLHWSITSNETVYNTLLTLAVYVVSFLIILIIPIALRKKRITLSEFGWGRLPYWKDIFLAVAAIILYYILSGILMLAAIHLIPGFNADQSQDVGYSNLSGSFEYLMAFVTLVILVPAAEETLFRGYLYGKLRKSTSIVASVIITSLVFAVLHGSLNVGIDVFAMSVVSCVLRESTGSVWSSFLLHMFKNGIAYFFLFIYPIISVTLGA